MALPEFLQQLDEFAANAVKSFGSAGDQAALEQSRIEYLGARVAFCGPCRSNSGLWRPRINRPAGNASTR